MTLKTTTKESGGDRAEAKRFSPKQLKFLKAFAKCGIIAEACRKARISRTNHYKWIASAVYHTEFEEAATVARESLEEEVQRRAVKGTLKPVFYQGEKCGTIREFSDSLLMFRLKKLDPSYRENSRVEHTGEGGGAITVQVTFVKAA